METLEIILLIARILVCISFTGVLVYFILILNEVKKIFKDLADVAKIGRDITTSIASPINSISKILEGVSKGVSAIKSITNIFNNKEDSEDDYEEY
ncbi:MAG TPA: hypothetical protein PKH50_01445 [bacterium]|nr:hypothetical protein [bacterium]